LFMLWPMPSKNQCGSPAEKKKRSLTRRKAR